MRWLSVLTSAATAIAALACTACSDDFDPFGLDSTTAEPEPEPTFDYSVCAPPMRDASCSPTDCGLTPEAQGYLDVMLDEVLQAGHIEVFTPTKAEYDPYIDELRIDYQLQVSWFRYATTVHFDVPDTEELMRQEMAAHIAGWRVPSTVARPEELSAAVEQCHALLEYDPCTDDHPDFFVHDSYDWSNPDCVYKSTSVVIDAQDASTLECVVEAPQPCP